jgi:hypothetical protein
MPIPGLNQQTAASVAEQRALPAAIDNLTQTVGNLEQAIYSLRAQLNPILDMVGCDGAKDDMPQAIEPYHHYEKISRANGRVQELHSIVSDLSARLHV